MSKGNTELLKRIIHCLGDQLAAPQEALERLEQEFESELLIVAGDVRDVSKHALKLCLAITLEERSINDTFLVQVSILVRSMCPKLCCVWQFAR